MKQFWGTSQTGNLMEAIKGLHDPKMIILMSNADKFEEHVAELEKQFPGVPSIGCIGMSYADKVTQKGVSVVAYTDGVKAVANVIEQVSAMPVKYIKRLEQDIQLCGASDKDTVCIDFCTHNDACLLTTMYSVLGRKHISLTGGTGDAGKVSANGKVYEDAAVYCLIKNLNGKIKVYKENIYENSNDYRLIASKTDRNKYIIGELNGKPAKQVYQDALQISESKISEQTFKNPFGKISGEDICIISIKEVAGNSLACFRQVNDSDVLTILELGDYQQIVENTIRNIKQDFNGHISGVFSVNCLFRYLLFNQNKFFDDYLKKMGALGAHAGLVGYGEHYNNQFVNQTMSCVVFE